MKNLQVGDCVKLTDRYAAVLMRWFKPNSKRAIDWKKRRGTVKRLQSGDAAIIWDGRSSVDLVPYDGVEKASR